MGLSSSKCLDEQILRDIDDITNSIKSLQQTHLELEKNIVNLNSEIVKVEEEIIILDRQRIQQNRFGKRKCDKEKLQLKKLLDEELELKKIRDKLITQKQQLEYKLKTIKENLSNSKKSFTTRKKSPYKY